jgi:hypothetical protein
MFDSTSRRSYIENAEARFAKKNILGFRGNIRHAITGSALKLAATSQEFLFLVLRHF